MGIEIIIASFAALLGILSLFKGIFSYKNKEDKTILMKLKDGTILKIPSDISNKDFEKLIPKLRDVETIDNIKTKLKKNENLNEAGFISSEFFLFFVPGIIALLFAGTFVYLIIVKRDIPNYSTPKELGSAMTTIIGYFFGVGVTTAANKGKTLELSDVKKLIDENE